MNDPEEDDGPSIWKLRTVENNPLQIEEILRKVFQFLDTETLLLTRLVSFFWYHQASRQIFRNSWTRIQSPSDFHTGLSPTQQNDLRLALKSLMSNSTSKSDPIHLTLRDYRDTQIYTEIRLFSDKVTTLTFEGQSGHDTPYHHGPGSVGMDTEHLSKILDKLPNLRVLESTCLDLSADQLWLKSDTDGVKFKSFLNKLSCLQIKLNFWLHASTLRNYVSLKDHLKGLESLRINNHQVFSFYVDQVSGLDWKIETLRLMANNEVPTEVIRHFLRSVSTTLCHLRLSFFHRLGRESPSNDPVDPAVLDNPIINCHIPWTLSELQSLEIYEDDPRLEVKVWKVVAVALQLSQLVKLVIRGSISLQCDDFLRQWTLKCPDRPLQSQSLKELVLWPKILSSSSILYANCWPNLKSLTIKLEINQGSTPAVFLAIFCELSRLERLQLFLKDDHSTGHRGEAETNFDELVTGIKRPVAYTSGLIFNEDQLKDSQFKSIRNLHNLKGLKMDCVDCCEGHKWTDFVIYNGLLHLKTLQTVQMSRKFISKKAIQDLRDELGSNVHIYFHNEGY